MTPCGKEVSFSWEGRLCTRKHTKLSNLSCVFVRTASPPKKKRQKILDSGVPVACTSFGLPHGQL